MKLLIALALLALIVVAIVIGIVSLVAGGKAGLTSGAALLAVFLVLVLAVVIAVYWLKRKLKKAFAGFADATKAAAGAVLPEVITLQPVRFAEEDLDTEKIDRLSAELRSLGYQEAGDFKIPELSMEPLLRTFANVTSNTFAVIYHSDQYDGSPWVDVVSRFGENNALTTTNLALAGLLNKPPKVRTQKIPEASVGELVAQHNERVAQLVAEEGVQPEPVSAEAFPERFLTAYHEERRFREAQGGPTEEEVRRVADATMKDSPASDEVVSIATEALREAQQGKALGAGEDGEENEGVPAPAFEQAAMQPSFRDAVQEVAKLCGCAAEANSTILGGVTFRVDHRLAEAILSKWHGHFLERGAYLFRSNRNFGAGGKPDALALLPTDNRDDVIRAMGTNGCNYDVDTEDIIQWLDEVELEQPFIVTGVGMDFLEGKFTTPIKDPDGFAKRMYEFCPDIVEQGTETIEALAGELRKTQKLYFWWD